ncbi:hypothetical protein FOL47_006469 [Perkinsus chesapeaki]|uniref:Uncharacterized protein n=1 Tax=Perkinsus chesapeaki TaxID=330153 RepID=A0A7J6LS67_PERCH|nr:hypothetical protein FOL47_006469 [Perkinsus chesapeaki]
MLPGSRLQMRRGLRYLVAARRCGLADVTWQPLADAAWSMILAACRCGLADVTWQPIADAAWSMILDAAWSTIPGSRLQMRSGLCYLDAACRCGAVHETGWAAHRGPFADAAWLMLLDEPLADAVWLMLLADRTCSVDDVTWCYLLLADADALVLFGEPPVEPLYGSVNGTC